MWRRSRFANAPRRAGVGSSELPRLGVHRRVVHPAAQHVAAPRVRRARREDGERGRVLSGRHVVEHVRPRDGIEERLRGRHGDPRRGAKRAVRAPFPPRARTERHAGIIHAARHHLHLARQAQLARRVGRERAQHLRGGHDLGEKRARQTRGRHETIVVPTRHEVVHARSRRVGEVGRPHAAETEVHVILRAEYRRGAAEPLQLVRAEPHQLENGIERGRETVARLHVPRLLRHLAEESLRLGTGARVAPDRHSRTQEVARRVKRHHAERVSGDAERANGLYLFRREPFRQTARRLHRRAPPVLRRLLVEARRGVGRGVGVESGRHARAVRAVERRLDAASSEIVCEDVHVIIHWVDSRRFLRVRPARRRRVRLRWRSRVLTGVRPPRTP